MGAILFLKLKNKDSPKTREAPGLGFTLHSSLMRRFSASTMRGFSGGPGRLERDGFFTNTAFGLVGEAISRWAVAMVKPDRDRPMHV